MGYEVRLVGTKAIIEQSDEGRFVSLVELKQRLAEISKQRVVNGICLGGINGKEIKSLDTLSSDTELKELVLESEKEIRKQTIDVKKAEQQSYKKRRSEENAQIKEQNYSEELDVWLEQNPINRYKVIIECDKAIVKYDPDGEFTSIAGVKKHLQLLDVDSYYLGGKEAQVISDIDRLTEAQLGDQVKGFTLEKVKQAIHTYHEDNNAFLAKYANKEKQKKSFKVVAGLHVFLFLVAMLSPKDIVQYPVVDGLVFIMQFVSGTVKSSLNNSYVHPVAPFFYSLAFPIMFFGAYYAINNCFQTNLYLNKYKDEKKRRKSLRQAFKLCFIATPVALYAPLNTLGDPYSQCYSWRDCWDMSRFGMGVLINMTYIFGGIFFTSGHFEAYRYLYVKPYLPNYIRRLIL